MSDRYILDGHTPVPCEDLLTWARWLETATRRVAETQIGTYRVSTVFLGLNHSFGAGPPLLFETMIFGGTDADEFQERYTTWDKAVKGHEEAVALVQAQSTPA